jgi:uncharacterized protein YkwD
MKKLLVALLVILFLFLAYKVATGKETPNVVKTTETKASVPVAVAPAMSVENLVAETNKARYENDVAAVTQDAKLNQSAQTKCNDMVTRNYWAHNTPDGQEPWVFMTQAGIQYYAAGENLAYGFRTPSDVMTGWLNSPGHRVNLLNDAFTDVGFGICYSNNYVGDGRQTIVVQHFIRGL